MTDHTKAATHYSALLDELPQISDERVEKLKLYATKYPGSFLREIRRDDVLALIERAEVAERNCQRIADEAIARGLARGPFSEPILTDEMIVAEAQRRHDHDGRTQYAMIAIAKWARDFRAPMPTLEQVQKALCMAGVGCTCIIKDIAHDCTAHDFETHARAMLALFRAEAKACRTCVGYGATQGCTECGKFREANA